MMRTALARPRSALRPLALLGALVVAILVATLGLPRAADAHADLERSIPRAGAVLEEAPRTVEVTYTERIAPAQSDIQVFDVGGARVDLGDARLVEGTAATMRVSLRDGLPPGAYTVRWNNLSTVDGHTLSGSFVFFVGSDEFEALEVATGGDGFPLGDALARWGVLLGLVLLAGVPWVFGFVLAKATTPEEALALRPSVEGIALMGGALALLASAIQVTLMVQETGAGWGILAETRWGNGWAARFILTAVATAGYILGPWRSSRHLRIALPYVALGAAASVSLIGHGAAIEGAALVAGAVDAVHVLATVAWGGGLVAFLVLAARSRSDRAAAEVLRTAIPRFTVLGAIATAALAITGTYAAWVHVGVLETPTTTYGRGVALKVLLLGALVLVAAVNTTWVRRRVSHPREVSTGRRWLRRLLSVEVGIIAVVLAASAVLTSIEPARAERIAEERAAGVVETTEDSGLTIRTSVTPGEVGPNRVTVELTRRGEPYEDATGVQLRYANMEAALSASTTPMTPEGGGRWTLEQPAILSVSGVYEFAVRVQWPEGVDARQSVQFETGADRATGILDPSTAWWAGILALVAVGAVMVVANVVASRRRVLRGERLGWSGAALAAGALLLWGNGPEGVAEASNPFPATPASIAEGGDIYATYCASCHGEGFRGDGPAAAAIPVRPADLVLHFPMHSDGQHYAVIADGRPASGMPAWEGALTAEQIWHVINYLRAETEARAPTRATP